VGRDVADIDLLGLAVAAHPRPFPTKLVRKTIVARMQMMARPPARHTPYEHEGRCSNGCRSVNKGYWNGGSGTSANHSEAEEKGAFDSELAERTAAPNGDYLAIFQIAKISRHRQAFPTTPVPGRPPDAC